jgi:hypothetical protein
MSAYQEDDNGQNNNDRNVSEYNKRVAAIRANGVAKKQEAREKRRRHLAELWKIYNEDMRDYVNDVDEIDLDVDLHAKRQMNRDVINEVYFGMKRDIEAKYAAKIAEIDLGIATAMDYMRSGRQMPLTQERSFMTDEERFSQIPPPPVMTHERQMPLTQPYPFMTDEERFFQMPPPPVMTREGQGPQMQKFSSMSDDELNSQMPPPPTMPDERLWPRTWERSFMTDEERFSQTPPPPIATHQRH